VLSGLKEEPVKANKVAEYLLDLLVSRTGHVNNAAVLAQLRSGGSDMSEQARLVSLHAHDDVVSAQHAAADAAGQVQADELHAAQSQAVQLQAEALHARQAYLSAAQSAQSAYRVYQPPAQHVTAEYVTQRHEYVTNNYRAGDMVTDNRTITDIVARGNVKFDQHVNNVTALPGGVAAGGGIHDAAVNTGTFKGVQTGSGNLDAGHAVVGDGNTSVQHSDVGALGTNGGRAFNVAGNAVFGSGSVNDIHGEGKVAQGGSTITDVANHGPGNLNAGNGTLNDVTAHGDGPVAVDHSSANQVTATGQGQAVVGSGNKLTGDVSVDLHHNQGPASVAVGDRNDQAAARDDSTRDSHNTHTVSDDHGDHATTDSFNHHSVDDSANHSVDSHDSHTVEGSFNHPTTTTIAESANHSVDSHDTHRVEGSSNQPSYDSHDLTHSVDDSYHQHWDGHDSTHVDDSYNHPVDSYNHSWDDHDPTHHIDDAHNHPWDLTHHA
jgi:hypothetical protein